MANYKATETCGCGANINAEAYTESTLSKMLTAWRAEHRHVEPAPTPLHAELVSQPDTVQVFVGGRRVTWPQREADQVIHARDPLGCGSLGFVHDDPHEVTCPECIDMLAAPGVVHSASAVGWCGELNAGDRRTYTASAVTCPTCACATGPQGGARGDLDAAG